ncbi:MAG: hypothetical protein ABL930_07140 [Pseudobdellovibrio sp.]
MKSLSSLVTLLLILTSLNAFALNKKIPFTRNTMNHLTIGSVEVKEINADFVEYYLQSEANNSLFNTLNDKINDLTLNATPIGRALTTADLIVDKVINIGTKIWTVVEKGRPVANYTGAKANALPQNALRWDQLSNWQMPKSKVISVVYKNLYGIEVVRFTYRIILLYGGSVNGVGRYIGYASVEPLEMTTAYMYTFNAKANVEAVFNMGTSQDPLAGMILNINWTVETVLKKTTVTHTYNLDGSGNIAVPSSSNISSLK